MREQHRRERQQQRREPEDHRRGRPEPRLEPLDRPAQQDEQQERRQHDRPAGPICHDARSGTPSIAVGIRLARVRVRAGRRRPSGAAGTTAPTRSPSPVPWRRSSGRSRARRRTSRRCTGRSPRCPSANDRVGGVVGVCAAPDRLHRQRVRDGDGAECDRGENGRALHGRTISRAAAPSPRARLTRGPGRECLALLPSGPDAVRKLPHHGAWPEQTAPGTGAV